MHAGHSVTDSDSMVTFRFQRTDVRVDIQPNLHHDDASASGQCPKIAGDNMFWRNTYTSRHTIYFVQATSVLLNCELVDAHDHLMNCIHCLRLEATLHAARKTSGRAENLKVSCVSRLVVQDTNGARNQVPIL